MPNSVADPEVAPRVQRRRVIVHAGSLPHAEGPVEDAERQLCASPCSEVVAQFESLSPKLAMQIPVSAAEHLADCPRDDRSEHSESRFDLKVVVNDAATRII